MQDMIGLMLISFILINLPLERAESSSAKLAQCGTSGSIISRIRDCKNRNSNKSVLINIKKNLSTIEKLKNFFTFKNVYYDEWSLVSYNNYSVWKKQHSDLLIVISTQEKVTYNKSKKICSSINIRPTSNFSISFKIPTNIFLETEEYQSFKKGFLTKDNHSFWITKKDQEKIHALALQKEKNSKEAFTLCVSS